MEDDDSHVGSPSPPFEGVITEEAESQLESQSNIEMKELNGDVEEVNIFLEHGDCAKVTSLMFSFELFSLIVSQK